MPPTVNSTVCPAGVDHADRVIQRREPVQPSQGYAVHEALSRLRPNDQEILRLAEWEDLPPRDIAVVLGCSANAASIRLHRAHRRFEEALRDLEAPLEIAPGQEQTQ
jgi:DNA-directed RNA polymerase specialized sigma24 family protein